MAIEEWPMSWEEGKPDSIPEATGRQRGSHASVLTGEGSQPCRPGTQRVAALPSPTGNRP